VVVLLWGGAIAGIAGRLYCVGGIVSVVRSEGSVARRRPKNTLSGTGGLSTGRKYPKRYREDGKWITARELEVLLGVRRGLVPEWCKTGKLTYQVGRGKFRFRLAWPQVQRLLRCSREQLPFWPRKANTRCKKCGKEVKSRSLCNACMLRKWRKAQAKLEKERRLYGA
jgi:hypothetical protein